MSARFNRGPCRRKVSESNAAFRQFLVSSRSTESTYYLREIVVETVLRCPFTGVDTILLQVRFWSMRC